MGDYHRRTQTLHQRYIGILSAFYQLFQDSIKTFTVIPEYSPAC